MCSPLILSINPAFSAVRLLPTMCFGVSIHTNFPRDGAGLRIDSVFFLNCNQNSKNSNFKELFSKNADNFIQLYNL